MASDHPRYAHYFDPETLRHFSYVRAEVIVRDELNNSDIEGLLDGILFTTAELPEELNIPFRLVRLDRSSIAEDDDPVIRLAQEHPDDVQPNHVFQAHSAAWEDPDHDCGVHYSQRLFEGRVDESLTARWIVPLARREGEPFNLPTDNNGIPESYSGMRASPLHMNPLHMNPLHMNPLHMNPLLGYPLHMNPLHMNGLINNALPVRKEMQREGPTPEVNAGEGVYIHIIDTGLTATRTRPALISGHPVDAQPPIDKWDQLSYWQTADSQNGGSDGYIDPVAGHGTFIAGIYAQLLPAAEITVAPAIGADGMVTEMAVVTRIYEAASVNRERKVLNLSFGGTASDFANGDGLDALHTAIKFAVEVGYVVVASAGNLSSCDRTFPAAFDEVVSVGALSADGVAWFSNYGTWVDCWAPGVDLISSFPKINGAFKPILKDDLNALFNGKFQYHEDVAGVEFPGFIDLDNFTGGWAAWSGTSFAAPIVGVAAANLLAAHNDPQTVPAQLKNDLQLTELPT